MRSHGVDLLQGYYYARPLPVEDFPRWLAEEKHRLAATGVNNPPGKFSPAGSALLFFVVIVDGFNDPYQIDAIIIGFNDGELQRRQFDNIAYPRDMTVRGDNQPGNGRDIIVFVDRSSSPSACCSA